MKKDSEKGISLIEVLLSITIIALVVVALNNLPNSIRLIGSTQKEVLAKDIASKQIEQLRLQSFANLSNGTTSIVDSRLGSLPASSGTVVISDCPGTVCNNGEEMKQVLVNISWQEQGDVKKVSLSTFIAEGGLK